MSLIRSSTGSPAQINKKKFTGRILSDIISSDNIKRLNGLTGEKMKIISVFIFMIFLLSAAGRASATSSMPEEVKPGEKENVCTTHVVYIAEHEGAVVNEQTSSILTFDAAVSKKEVLDKTASYLSNKLNEVNVAEFKVECKFAAIK